MKPTIQDMCISITATFKDVLQVIENNAQGICFVYDQNNKFCGVITDGDTRRSLLDGNSLNTTIEKIVNKNALSLPIASTSAEIQQHLSAQVKHIPLLNSENEIVDYACIHRMHRIPVMEPLLGGNELQYVTECIETGWISSGGSFVKRFEEEIAKFCGSQYALAVSNGTTALHLALVALGIGKGDEVIVPSFTFAASINAVIYTGATPVLVDVTNEDWTISINQIKNAITPNTKAILPVHIYSHPCQMDEILEIAKENELIVIEDCAESLGSTYKGKQTGTFGDAGTFSFFGNKVITTGEGGMILFKSKKHFEQAALLRDHGMAKDKRYWHEHVGFNYRMTNIQAAIGVAQLEQLPFFLNKRKEITSHYRKLLQDVKGIELQPISKSIDSCNWLFTILLSHEVKIPRDEFIQKLLKKGIDSRPTFYPMNSMPLYKKYTNNNSFVVSEDIASRGISLPSSVMLTFDEIDNIADSIKSILSVENIK